MKSIEEKLERVSRKISLFRRALKDGKLDLAEEHLGMAKDLSAIVNSDIQHLSLGSKK